MDEPKSIGIKITGEGMSPGAVRSKEIAELIEAVEEMIASMVVYRDPEIRKEDVVIGLKNLREGSLELEFDLNLQRLTLPAMEEIAQLTLSGNIESLPIAVVRQIKTLVGFCKANKCDAEFLELNGSSRQLITISSETEIPEMFPIRGETVLYGEITRVGGADPKIQFKTLDDVFIYCTTNKLMAQKAGEKLYSRVGLHGLAEWNVKTFEIESFHVLDISDYQQGSLSESFQELSKLVGGSFDQIEDLDLFFSEVRYS